MRSREKWPERHGGKPQVLEVLGREKQAKSLSHTLIHIQSQKAAAETVNMNNMK